VVNGDVVRTVRLATKETDSGGHSTAIDETLPLKTSSWAIVRCFEKQPDGRLRFAHSAPVHCEIDGPVRPKQREVAYFIDRMEKEIARNRDVLAAKELAEYEQALAIYQKLVNTARD
jgi:hypothetical protein